MFLGFFLCDPLLFQVWPDPVDPGIEASSTSSCCRSLWRRRPLFPDSRQGCWLRSIHRSLGFSLSGPFSGMFSVSGCLRCYLTLTKQVTRPHKPLHLWMGLLFYRQHNVCMTWCVLLCFPGLLVQRNRPEWHLIDQFFMAHGLEMRRRPATFRSPTLWRPVALTSLGELIIMAHNNFWSGESKERPGMPGNKLWL